MKATYQVKHCGGRPQANHADRTFDVSKAENIKSIKDDKAYIRKGDGFVRVSLGKGKFAQWEKSYYEQRFAPYIEQQKGKYLKKRQKSRAENCTVDKYYNNKTTGPTHMLYQVGKNGEYQEYDKFREMVFSDIEYIEEHYQTEDARIKCLDIAFHGYDGAERSLHAHTAWSFEVRNKDGVWVQDTERCLEKLGVELPEPDKKKDRYNNRKMTFTAAMQERWYDIVEEIDKDVKIDRTPAPKPVNNKHRAAQCIYEMGEIIDSLKTIQDMLSDLDKCFDKLSEKDRKKHIEDLHKAIVDSNHKFGGLQEKYMLKEEEVLPVSDLIKDTQAGLEELVEDDDFGLG